MHTDVRINLEPAVRIAILLLFPCVSRKERLSVWMPHQQPILRGVRSSLLRFRVFHGQFRKGRGVRPGRFR